MRTTLFSLLVLLAQSAMPANAQDSGLSLRNGSVPRPSTRRLFFFPADPKSVGRPAELFAPAQPPRPSGLFVRPATPFPPFRLLPRETMPPQDFRPFLRPRNTRLFFFNRQ